MTDFLAAAQRIASMLLTGSEVAIIVWLVSGGIIYLLRGISFWLDTLIVNFISSIYTYFMKLLEGTLFSDAVVDALLSNVYVFIGVFVFFRLATKIIQYLMDPTALMDEKTGVNALIKRVVIGSIGMLLVPFIFDTLMDLQVAVIKDQVIQQIIIPKDMIDATSKKTDSAGKYLGTYVFSGFLNPSSKASNKLKNEYEIALAKGDLSSVDFNSGGFLGVGYTSYDYSYFYLLSTFVLAYVLYLMLKYCLDIVVRFFKLLLYELFAPIAMVEYMLNGSDDGVFKNWKNAVLGTYFMLFVRVLSIWFVVLVMTLMSGEYAAYTNQTLLSSNDYLLRALIIVGLLGFMMDLPKLVGNIFGIDLEQESSATGVMKSIGGIVKGVGMGALAMGGAALGGAVGALGGVQKAGLSNILARNKALGAEKKGLREANQNLSRREINKQAKANVSNALHGQNAAAVKSSGSAMKSAAMGMLGGMAGAAIASTAVGKTVQSGYSGVQQHMSSDRQKERQQSIEAEETGFRQETINIARQQSEEVKVQGMVELAANLKASGIPPVNLPDAIINAKINADNTVPSLHAKLNAVADPSTGQINDKIEATRIVTTQMRDVGMSETSIQKAVQEVETKFTTSGSLNASDAGSIVDKAYKNEFGTVAKQAADRVNPNPVKP